MKTADYVDYAKKGGIAGFVLFVFGALSAIITNVLSVQLPPSFEGVFFYMIGLGVVAIFVSILTAGILPLALE